MLVDTFLEETDVQLIKADIVDCWDTSEGDVPQQCDTGCFAEVVSYLDELAMQPPTRDTWETLVFPMPMVGEDSRHQSFTGLCPQATSELREDASTPAVPHKV